MKASGKVVFFGSGPVAARCLDLLVGHATVEAVITKPKPAHHKYELPVVEVAGKHSLPVHYAADKTELDSLISQQAFSSQLAVLIDFGIIVSKAVISTFPLGVVNSHFSLLPHWRGADPITFAIISGDEKTGVSLMLIDEGMDTGKLLTYRTLHMQQDETAVSLTAKLIALSNDLLAEFLPMYIKGDIKPKNQPHPDRATYSRKLTKQDGIIDWEQPAAQIERNIRGFIEWPQSHARLGPLNVIITKAHVSQGTGQPGSYRIHGNDLSVFTGDNVLVIDMLKPEGKKEMPVQAFLAGYKNKL